MKKMDTNLIKGVLIALAASFLFACAAEAQTEAIAKHVVHRVIKNKSRQIIG